MRLHFASVEVGVEIGEQVDGARSGAILVVLVAQHLGEEVGVVERVGAHQTHHRESDGDVGEWAPEHAMLGHVVEGASARREVVGGELAATGFAEVFDERGGELLVDGGVVRLIGAALESVDFDGVVFGGGKRLTSG